MGLMGAIVLMCRLVRWSCGLGCVLIASATANAETVNVAVAMNFKTVLEKLEPIFEGQSGHDLVISSGSTGKLFAQIRYGAPYDVFLAADEARPERLESLGAGVAGSRFSYAIGRLVLWSPNGEDVGPEILASDGFRHIAIANPELAPYGAAAMDVLSALGQLDNVRDRIVYGQNVGQAFALVATGNAELGFVARSQMLDFEPDRQAGDWWEPSQALYTPIRQDAVLLKDRPAAHAFMAFLKSDDAKRIITDSGYSAP